MKKTRILIAASGTGGHLLPAVVVAKRLQSMDPNCIVEFIGSGRPLEARVIEDAGFKRHTLLLSGFVGGGIRGIATFLLRFPGACARTWSIFSEFKPDAVLGVGGYVSVPAVLVAWLRGVPAWIHEAEIEAGWANYLLSFFASKISVAFEHAKIPFKGRREVTGHPVRDGLEAAYNARSEVSSPKNILILGGSQGANALDVAAEKLMPLFKERGLSVVHQAREENLDRLKAKYKEYGIDSEVLPFIDEMSEKFAWSDLVISRAGAGATTDIGVVNRPAILVPFPYAQGQHQRANAMTLVSAGKALLVEEGETKFDERLRDAVERLLKPDEFRSMKDRPRVDRGAKASEAIAQGVLALANTSR